MSGGYDMSNNDVDETWTKWVELKTLVEMTDLDVLKNARGVAAAGVRARKGLRLLKTKATELVKLTVQIDKAKKQPKS
jgi:hypothetical protein